MTNTLGRPVSSSNSLRIKACPSAPTILGAPISTLDCDKMRICDNDYELTPQNYKALSYTAYTGKSMKNETDILMMKIFIRDLGYRGIGDRDSNILHKKLPN